MALRSWFRAAGLHGILESMSAPAALAEATLLTPEGEAVPLASLWKEGPAVLVFVRHFG